MLRAPEASNSALLSFSGLQTRSQFLGDPVSGNGLSNKKEM